MNSISSLSVGSGYTAGVTSTGQAAHSLLVLNFPMKSIPVSGAMSQPKRVQYYIRAKAINSPTSVPNRMRSKLMERPKISMITLFYLPDGTESSTGTNTTTKPTVVAGRTAVVTLVTATL
ncbi:hypothetical protein [Paenibacillus sp. FSL H7-689]|uniref:hypothetical protein n=1 Tax=Paenibacillus sp. FSL H7-689 TaxID=1227349 RepID=UPI0003E1F302|nr:hypothetical protein [Paenibacillus sp. FSL H7-689]ETT44848.1 hypothetical protein C170_23140 [Paenibacillus sp. FSL H7-689]